VIGLFGIGEILLTLEEGTRVQGREGEAQHARGVETWKELPRYWKTSIRSSSWAA
jgi:putative tricarboxylic transport membrane protein